MLQCTDDVTQTIRLTSSYRCLYTFMWADMLHIDVYTPSCPLCCFVWHPCLYTFMSVDILYIDVYTPSCLLCHFVWHPCLYTFMWVDILLFETIVAFNESLLYSPGNTFQNFRFGRSTSRKPLAQLKYLSRYQSSVRWENPTLIHLWRTRRCAFKEKPEWR